MRRLGRFSICFFRTASSDRRAAVGEYTAMAFLPLAAAGMYQIYTSNDTAADRSAISEKSDERKSDKVRDAAVEKSGKAVLQKEIRAILPAVLGFSGLILSHIITTFIDPEANRPEKTGRNGCSYICSVRLVCDSICGLNAE